MLPLSLSHYYSLDARLGEGRAAMIEKSRETIREAVDHRVSLLLGDFTPAFRYFNRSLRDNPSRAEKLETSQSANDFVEESHMLWEGYVRGTPYEKILEKGKDLKVIPQSLFREMEPWLTKGYMFEEDNKIYIWRLMELIKGRTRDEMETIGGLFVKTPLIEKHPNRNFYDLKIGLNPNYLVPVVIAPRPSHLEPHLPRDAYERLFGLKEDGVFEEVEVSGVSLPLIRDDGVPLQAWLKPIVNQHRQLSAVMIIAYPIVDVWNMIGPSTIKAWCIVSVIMVVVAVLVARSISRPMYELVDVADQMSRGDFSVRSQVKGTVEQQVLRKTFNQLAERINTQIGQLHRQTSKLETSNRDLAQTQRFLENILSNIHTGVLSVDRDGRVTLVNQVGLDILGTGQLEGKRLEETEVPLALMRIVRYSLDKCVSICLEEINCRVESGENRPVQVSTVPILQQGVFSGLVVTLHDLSAIRKLEEEVRRHDRLVALGQMAGGLAHEIRNPLGIIRGSAELLNKRFGGKPGEEGLSEFIIEEVNRLSRVLTEFLLFARPPVPNRERISVRELLGQILAYNINLDERGPYVIRQEIEESAPDVYADLEMCKQAFLNLLLNARDAMPEGGVIQLRSYKNRRGEAVIEVRDEGVGIRPELLDRIFDPFVTTKENGTGLGLSLVHQIISSQGGKVEVDSGEGKGSVFRVILPAYRGEEGLEPGSVAAGESVETAVPRT